MKKLFIALTGVLALSSLVSCQKENLEKEELPNKEGVTVKIVSAPGTKTYAVDGGMPLYAPEGDASEQAHDYDHRKTEQLLFAQETVRYTPHLHHKLADCSIPVRGVRRKHQDALLNIREFSSDLKTKYFQ